MFFSLLSNTLILKNFTFHVSFLIFPCYFARIDHSSWVRVNSLSAHLTTPRGWAQKSWVRLGALAPSQLVRRALRFCNLTSSWRLMVLMAAAAFWENEKILLMWGAGRGLQLRTREVRAGQPFQNKSQSGRKRDQLGKLVCSGEHRRVWRRRACAGEQGQQDKETWTGRHHHVNEGDACWVAAQVLSIWNPQWNNTRPRGSPEHPCHKRGNVKL